MKTPGLLSPEASASQQSAQSTNQKSMGRDDFLKLLVTQLENQDPLNPMKGQEFAAQLAQFSSVEQLVQIRNAVTTGNESSNTALDQLNSGLAAGFIGKTAEAQTNQVYHDGQSSSDIHFELASAADEVTVTIATPTGNPVRRLTLGEASAGKHTITWDGKTASNIAAAEGRYQVHISAADGAGNTVEATPFQKGTVDKVSFENDNVQLWVNNVRARLEDLASVSVAP